MQYQSKNTAAIFWRHTWRYKWQAITLIVGVLIVEGLQTYTPLYYRNLFNLLAGNHDSTVFNQGIKIVWIILILNAIRIGLWRAVNFVNNYFQPKVMADLTNSCYEYLQKHSYNFFSGNFVGSLVTKVKRYERSYETISDQIIYDLGRTILDTSLVLAVLFWQYPTIAWVIFVWCLIYFAFSYFYSLYKLPWDIKRASADTLTTAQLADSITNNINIKLFTNYEVENKKFYNVTENQRKLRKKSWDLGTSGDIIQSAMMILLEFGIMYWAVALWLKGSLLVGDVVLLQAYIYRISDKLWNTGKNVRAIYEAMADANEMTEMIQTPHEVQDKTANNLKVTNGEIKFKQVGFTYKNASQVLSKFNLTIAGGEKIALIGPSGGGKSTIIKLLLRFLDIQKGVIEIDGQDISQVTQDSLREAISFVPQEPILFHRSLMDNIRYAKNNASDQEVIAAAKLAHAHEFIIGFKEGYKTLVGERGIKLSGGERQRVAIARAILKNSPILILDEATSSLDSESEHYIQDALKTLMSTGGGASGSLQSKTVIIIAHRLSTIMQMDRIVVLENGKLTEQGKHQELLKMKKGTYQKLWQIQAGGFTSN